jgi:hypothetical protein
MASVETAWPKLRLGAINEAWHLYRRHWQVWSLTMLAAVLCAALADGLGSLVLYVASRGMLGELVGLNTPILPIVLATICGGFFAGGMIRMAINQVRGRTPHLEDLFTITDVWFDLVLGSALLGLLFAIGSGPARPGFIAAGMLMFTYPLIVDGRLPATGAMIQSFHALKSQWLLALVVHAVIISILGIGIPMIGIGILATGPISALSIAVLYRDVFLNPYSPEWTKPNTPDDEFREP